MLAFLTTRTGSGGAADRRAAAHLAVAAVVRAGIRRVADAHLQPTPVA